MPRPRSRLHFLLALLALTSPARAHEPGESEPHPGRTAPILVERAEPAYPPAAREKGIGGDVSLEITVAADGAVESVKVARPAGFGFDEAAVEAARRFRFKPATENGKPIASIVLFDQKFVVRPHLAAEASAEPPPVEDAPPPPPAPPVIEGPSRYRSVVSDVGPRTAASSMTVRDQDFELRPLSSPNDILRVVPGLLAVQHQGGGKADQLFLRGFDSDHGTDVGVFVDGVPINLPSHAHGQGYVDLHWIIPEAIERLDVMKGPYDPRWGDFSTAGAVNLVTRSDMKESSAQVTLGGYPSLGCPSFPLDCKPIASQRVVGIAAPHFTGWGERLHLWAAFEAARDDGPFDAPEALKRYNLFTKWSFDATPSTSFGIFFSAYGSGWTGSGQIPQREVAAGRLSPFGSIDPTEGGNTSRQMLTAFLKHKDASGELVATVYAVHYQLALWNDFTFFLNDPVHADLVEQDDNRWYAGTRLQYHFHRHVGPLTFRTTLGAEARWDAIDVQRWNATSQDGAYRQRLHLFDTESVATSGANAAISQVNLAAFVEEDLVVNRYFRVLAALRADYFGWNVEDRSATIAAATGAPSAGNTSGAAERAFASPKLSAVVTPVPGWLDLFLNFGMGLHTNNAAIALRDGREVTEKNADGTTSSYAVKAVPRLYGGEIGARARLFRRVELAAAFWLSQLDNETVFDADAAAFVPSEPTRRLGFDLEARAEILPWLFADLDLAQASATAVRDVGNGGAVALAPRLYLTGGLTARHAKTGLRGGLRFRYLGDRPAFDESSPEYQHFTAKTRADGSPNPDYDPSRVTAPGYFVVDAFVGWRWRFLEASLAAQNLFNASWREAQFGNASCTRDETSNPMNPNYAGSGAMFADGTLVNRCGYKPGDAAWNATRSGVVDVHYTPGVPINLQLTLKVYF